MHQIAQSIESYRHPSTNVVDLLVNAKKLLDNFDMTRMTFFVNMINIIIIIIHLYLFVNMIGIIIIIIHNFHKSAHMSCKFKSAHFEMRNSTTDV